MKRTELLEQLQAAAAGAGSKEASLAAVTALIEKARADDDAEERANSNAGKPRVEMLTYNQVAQLLDERDRKMREHIDAKLAGASQMRADRTLPMEVRDAEVAADAYGIQAIPIEERMVYGRFELAEASIEGVELEKTRRAQRLAGQLHTMGALTGKDPRSFKRYRPYQSALKDLHDHRRETRAMDEFTAGEGLEWVPTKWTGELLDRIQADLIIAGLFPHIRMTTKDQTYGLRGALPVIYHLGNYPLSDVESAIPASTPGTADMALHAKDLLGRVIVANNLTEDAAFAVLPIVQQDLVRANQEAIEDAFFNGDTAAAMDTAYAYTLSPRTAFDGIRKVTQSGQKYDVTTGATAFASTDIDEVRLLMGSLIGAQLSRLVMITSFKAQVRMGQFGDVRSVQEYGPNAVILRGELGNILGLPILISPAVPTNLNASGIYDGITQTYTIIQLVHRDGFIIGDRKEVTVQQGDMIETGQRQLVTTWRGAFTRRYGTTIPEVTAQGYKVS